MMLWIRELKAKVVYPPPRFLLKEAGEMARGPGELAVLVRTKMLASLGQLDIS